MHGRTTLTTALLIGLAVLTLGVDLSVPSGAIAFAEEKEDPPAKKPRVDADSVYYGRTNGFKRPAEVDVDAVYAVIPEYRKLLEKELDPDDAEYVLLMTKASRRFKKAVRSAARALQHDLVARIGAVENVSDVPDISQEVIDRL